MTFKRFNTSEANNYDQTALEPGTLTWDSDNGLRIHDGSTSGGNTVGGGADTGFTRFIGSGIGSYDTDSGSSYNMIITPNWDGEFPGQVSINLPSNENFGSPLQIVHNSDGGIQLITKNNATWTFDKDGNLTLPVNGDIVDSNGTSVLGGGSSSPAGAGSTSYSDVWVYSDKADSFWTQYSLTGNIAGIFGSAALTGLNSQVAYGKQMSTGDKVLNINDHAIHTDSTYGIVFEFPSSPAAGDTFSTPLITSSTTVTAGSFTIGTTYTIVNPGTTDFTAIGAGGNFPGLSFVATGIGSGSGTASVSSGVGKAIYKPAAGQKAVGMSNGQGDRPVFGEGTNYIAGYIDVSSQMGGNPVVWVYAGVISSVPTWYQFYF